jgi:hypothetical protein
MQDAGSVTSVRLRHRKHVITIRLVLIEIDNKLKVYFI